MCGCSSTDMVFLDVDNFEALQVAFKEMNDQTGNEHGRWHSVLATRPRAIQSTQIDPRPEVAHRTV